MTTLEKTALNWWNNLPNDMKNEFPEPNDNDDIVNYYSNPGYYLSDFISSFD